ncbi:MAG: VCBS repeat-containing protein [Bacteroidota bacterium]
MRRLTNNSLSILTITLLFFSCQKRENVFELVPPDQSGMTFSNTIFESDSIHYFNFPYIYTGAGVGVGDFNNDGFPDIFFAGNMVSSRLYINQGNRGNAHSGSASFQFEDVSRSADIETNRWATGVSIADVNQDGWLDIYLCVGGFAEAEDRKNLLFINNHNLTFTESAELYGLADDGFSTQAAFFDYDRDGDLDVYVMEHANEAYAAVSKLYTYKDGRGPSTDKLYENVATADSPRPFYRDVSDSVGILIEGYGLGLAISDINQDGWPDIYVANDFIASDLLYINNPEGQPTFENRLDEYVQHISRNGMGVDVADINNDALPDILVLDMLPPTAVRQKTMTASMNYEYFRSTLKQNFSPQFIRNTLQINRGVDPDGNYRFSELGRLAGLHETDWSWSSLIVDFDNDGLKDVYITNGFRRDVTDHDFQEYTEQTNAYVRGSGKLSIPEVVEKLLQLDSVCLPNFMFQNQDSLQFADRTQDWGMDHPSMSNGSAYADFDQDGDLDLVVNNINAPAFLYKNEGDPKSAYHHLRVKLVGKAPNRNAIGAKVTATLVNGRKLYYENYPVRGYMSTSESTIHMGLGEATKLDTLEIIWPDGKQQWHTGLVVDTTYQFSYGDRGTESLATTNQSDSLVNSHLFEEVSTQLVSSYQHEENLSEDFRYEPLLLHQFDNYGPGLAVGDMNGDNKADFYVGGARYHTGTFFFQADNQTFETKELVGTESYEDMGSLLFDADQDSDLDLYVVSGGSSVKFFNKGHYQDRLYTNDGQGNFTLNENVLPEINTSGSCVVAADFDQDDDIDLFVGGRMVPGKFPTTPRSYLLMNQDGKFYDRTEELAEGLSEVGMVCSALWTDYDNDQDIDLMVAGEWMPITVFENTGGRLHKRKDTGLESYWGWWNSLAGGDMDRDGDIDYVAGNLGENTTFKIKPHQPLRMYAKDFDGNASIDAIITRYINDKETPIASRGTLIDQLSVINRMFPTYHQFATADVYQVLDAFDTTDMQVLETTYIQSAYLENQGNGRFLVSPLPMEAQVAPLYGLKIRDCDADGYLDILGIGNDYQTEVISGWYDAHQGIYLRGDGTGRFKAVASGTSGFFVNGDARALGSLYTPTDVFTIATVNADSLRIFRSASSDLPSLSLQPNEVWIEIKYRDGSNSRLERNIGQGYLSQSSFRLLIHDTMRSVTITNWAGHSRTVTF